MGITFGTPSDAEVLGYALDKRERNTAKALPGTVVSYDEGAQTCSVTPGVHRLVPSADDEDVDETEPLPTLQDVPVCWLVGRGIQVKAKLQAGDSVLLIAMDRDIDGWMRSGKPAEPDDARMNSWGSAIAIPGLVPTSSPFPEPTDAAALASALNLLIGVLLAWVPVPLDGGAALKALLVAAFPNIPPAGLSGTPVPLPPIWAADTTGSSVLLLDEPLLP